MTIALIVVLCVEQHFILFKVVVVSGHVGRDPKVFLPDVSSTMATDIIKECDTVLQSTLCGTYNHFDRYHISSLENICRNCRQKLK